MLRGRYYTTTEYHFSYRLGSISYKQLDLTPGVISPDGTTILPFSFAAVVTTGSGAQ